MAAKPTTGMGLYKDFCMACHDPDARGTTVGQTIRGKTAEVLIQNVRGGHHAGEFSNRTSYMPKWSSAQLTDAEIRLIHTYVSTL